VHDRHLGDAGVRTIALFEVGKGALVLLAGFGVLLLVHRGAQEAAEELVRHLHLNPAHRYPQVFIRAAARLRDTRLGLLAAGALAYSTLRFVEAYGLWRLRPWAEWVAIVSSALYMPIELWEWLRRPTPIRAFVLLTNGAIVAGLLYRRWHHRRKRHAQGMVE
jgi:uncharacterized membrane protein (DUF2068 family)